MRKRVQRALLGTVLSASGVAGAIATGCVSNTAAVTITNVDGSIQFTVDGAVFSNDTGTPVPGDETAPPPPPPGDASIVDATTPRDAADAAPVTGSIRFAWFVKPAASGTTGPTGPGGPPQIRPAIEDAGPVGSGFDVCVAPHGTGAWAGPLLAKSALSAGLQPFDVTSYFPVPPGQYDARIVASGSTTCDLADAGAPDAGDNGGEGGAPDAGPAVSTDFTSLPAVVAGATLTVALVNPSSSSTIADVRTFTDDTSTSAGKAKIRFVNVSGADTTVAADGGTDDAGDSVDAGTVLQGVSFGVGGGYVFTPLFTNVTSQEGIDPAAANGYVEVDPVSGIDTSISYPGQAEGLSTPPATDSLTLAAGTMLTAFYAPELGTDSGGALVWCYDGVPSATNPALTKCGFSDETTAGNSDVLASAVRFGDFLADTNALSVDVCVKYHSYGSYVGPLVGQAGTASGVPHDTLSAYFPLHGGYSFDVRFVVGAEGATCGTALSDMTLTSFSAPGGGYTSVLLTGYQNTGDGDAGAPPPYDAGPLLDAAVDDGGPLPVTTPLPTLAMTVVALEDEQYDVSAIPGMRLVHLDATHPAPMTMTVSSEGNWTLPNVPYGGISTQPFPVDPYGYVTTISGSMSLGIDVSSWTFNMLGEQASLFAYAGPKGEIELLACDDYNETYPTDNAGLYASCCIAGAGNCLSGGTAGIVGLGPQVRPAAKARQHRGHR